MKRKSLTSQLIFIDDSGDPGFNILKGASTHFVIVCVIFDDTLEAEKCAVAIKQLKRDLGFPDQMEFKFFKSRDEVKTKFLQAIMKYLFRIRAIVVDKNKVISPELQNVHDSFYNYFIKLVLQNNSGTLQNARVRLDGHGDKLFRRNIATYLRQNLNNKNNTIMDSIQLVDSKTNMLIQMADMIAGAIRRSYASASDKDTKYKRIIKKKIEDEWTFKWFDLPSILVVPGTPPSGDYSSSRSL